MIATVLALHNRCDLHLAHKRLVDLPYSSCLNKEINFKAHEAQIDQQVKRKSSSGSSSSSSSSSSGFFSGGSGSSSGKADAGELQSSISLFNLPSQSPSDPNPLFNLSPQLPLISILAATTTRKIVEPSTKNLSLFTLLLPSLVRNLDCGFRYEYVLGFDQGDAFYDSKEVRNI